MVIFKVWLTAANQVLLDGICNLAQFEPFQPIKKYIFNTLSLTISYVLHIP